MENQVTEIERIVKDGIGKELVVQDRHLVFGRFEEVRPFKPSFKTIGVSELSSLVAVIKSEYAEIMSKPVAPLDKVITSLFVEVETPHKVITYTHADNELTRTYPYIAEFEGNSFNFGKWQTYEDFIIALRSLFGETPERNALIELIASVRNVDDNEISDNGITQTASTRKGAILKTGEIKAIYNLTPYRTFREVTQIPAEYLFRIRKGGDELMFALFEADGGAWKLFQKDAIKAYLCNALEKEITEGNVVVIA